MVKLDKKVWYIITKGVDLGGLDGTVALKDVEPSTLVEHDALIVLVESGEELAEAVELMVVKSKVETTLVISPENSVAMPPFEGSVTIQELPKAAGKDYSWFSLTPSVKQPETEEKAKKTKAPEQKVEVKTSTLDKSVLKFLKGVETQTGIQMVLATAVPKKYKNVAAFGLWNLDYGVLGIGGAVPGRIYEFSGPEGSGKTTLVCRLVAAFQQLSAYNPKSVAVYIDIEHALDMTRVEALGVDLSRLIIIQPDLVDPASDALKLILEGVKSGEIHISAVAFDSIAAIPTAAEDNKESGAAEMMGRARFMSQFFRKVVARLGKTKTPLLLVNQVRDKVTATGAYGYSTPGGHAAKFASSVRMEVRRKDFIGPKDNPTGQVISIKAVKNKFAPPFKSCEINLYYSDEPFNFVESMIDFALTKGVLERAGAIYRFEGVAVAKGKEELIKLLKMQDMQEKTSILGKIYLKLMEQHFGEPLDSVEEVEDVITDKDNDIDVLLDKYSEEVSAPSGGANSGDN